MEMNNNLETQVSEAVEANMTDVEVTNLESSEDGISVMGAAVAGVATVGAVAIVGGLTYVGKEIYHKCKGDYFDYKMDALEKKKERLLERQALKAKKAELKETKKAIKNQAKEPVDVEGEVVEEGEGPSEE